MNMSCEHASLTCELADLADTASIRAVVVRDDDDDLRNANIVHSDDISDGDDEEILGLLSSSESVATTSLAIGGPNSTHHNFCHFIRRRDRVLARSTAFVSLMMVLALLSIVVSRTSGLRKTSEFAVPSYECPAVVTQAGNDKNDIFHYYDVDTKQHLITNETDLSQFMDMKYGSWDITPRQRKELNGKWIQWYADALDQGSSIYESGCGIGLTLYVILELLQERYNNPTHLQVYGNEYIPELVVSANQFYDHQQSRNSLLSLTKGRICHGDSTNLSFVPANAFDVVFTGYIDPIQDPLDLQLSESNHTALCRSSEEDAKSLVEKEQRAVEDWFAQWTTEMIRIAKPGGTIIIESIAHPQCELGDWGGVSPEWWTLAVARYGWDDIDADLIETIDFDPINRYSQLSYRYNVKLIKEH